MTRREIRWKRVGGDAGGEPLRKDAELTPSSEVESGEALRYTGEAKPTQSDD